MVVTGVTAMQPLMSSGHLAACREPWVEVKLGTPPHTCPAHPRILQQPKLNHCTPKLAVEAAQLARGGKCAEPTCSTGVQWLRLGHCRTLRSPAATIPPPRGKKKDPLCNANGYAKKWIGTLYQHLSFNF